MLVECIKAVAQSALMTLLWYFDKSFKACCNPISQHSVTLKHIRTAGLKKFYD